jgi:hypothetical protein
MKALIKTDKTLKIEPVDLVNLYKYAKYYIDWESDDFIGKLNEIFPYRKLPEYSKRIKFRDEKVIGLGASVYIPLDYILLPSHIYTRISKRIEDLDNPKGSERVSVDNLLLLDLYKVAPSPEDKFESIYLGIQISYSSFRDRYVISSLWLNAKDKRSSKSRRSRHYLIGMFFFDGFKEESEIIEYIGTMEQLEGKKYSKLDAVVFRNILWVEKSLILVTNLFHVLHSNKFDENDLVDSLFKKHSDLVKGFGDEFEDIISPVKVISAFAF